MTKLKGYIPIVVLITFGFVLIIAAAIVYYQLKPKPTPQSQPTPSPFTTPSPIDETANWKSYIRNKEIKFSIKYPDDFKVDELPGAVVIYKGVKLILPPNSPIDPYPISLGILDRGGDCGDCSGFQLKEINVAGYYAVEAIHENTLSRDIWIYSPDRKKVVRVGYGAHDQKDVQENKLIFEKMLSTFKFLGDETASWKVYTNDEIKFSLRYPPNWISESVPVQTKEDYKQVTLKGKEGYLDLLWGSGFGGACPQEYEDISIKNATLKVCHGVDADGSESWGGFSKDLGYTGFTANAKAYPPHETNREVILKIISSMEFNQ